MHRRLNINFAHNKEIHLNLKAPTIRGVINKLSNEVLPAVSPKRNLALTKNHFKANQTHFFNEIR